MRVNEIFQGVVATEDPMSGATLFEKPQNRPL
jgi:hypothetical protein